MRDIDQGLKIDNVPISSIIPYENNARNNKRTQIKLANSIKDTGYNSPIILDEDMVILAGHARFFSIRDILKWTHVPYIIKKVDNDGKPLLDEDTKKLYRLADNKIGELTQWDPSKFTNEVLSLMGKFDLKKYNIDQLDEADKADIDHTKENCNYPIMEVFSEKYDAIVIMCTNAIDFNNLKQILGIEKEEYSSRTGQGVARAITYERFKKCLNLK